jgi:hypothetical protein
VVPPGLLIEITTPETDFVSATRLNSSLMRWLPAMKPSTLMRAIWGCPSRNGTRPAAVSPSATTATMAPSTPSTRQNESLRRNRLRSAIISASMDIRSFPLCPCGPAP